MPEPKEHSEQRGMLESVLRKIPGFRGYLEKETRRESDQLQRDWLATRLERAKRGLDAASREWVDAGQIDALPLCDRLRGRLDKLIGRIRGAMLGYSGFFDLVQIGETELDRIYDYDVSLMDEVDELAATVEGLTSNSQPVNAVRQAMTQAEKLEQQWDVREDMLKGLK